MIIRSSVLLIVAAVISPAAMAGPPKKNAKAEKVLKQVADLEYEDECAAVLLLAKQQKVGHPRRYKKEFKRLLEELTDNNVKDGINSCAVVKMVATEEDLARAGKARQVTLKLATTIGWGCPCPPFVHTRMGGSASTPEAFLFMKPTKGFRSPEEVMVPGTFYVTGRFTGRRINTYEWFKMHGKPSRGRGGDRHSYYKKKHPLFEVDRWCYRRPRRVTRDQKRSIKEEVRRSDYCKKRRN